MTDSALPGPDQALEVAAVIGFQLARSAIWSGERCSWLDGVAVAPGQNPAISAMVGADVYGGSSGIGWFLAQAAARTGDPLLRRTAVAALRQAAARSGDLAVSAPHGFYGGAAGIGAALVAAGLELDDDQAVAAGRTLLLAIPAELADIHLTDLISGLSGDILAFALAAAALGGDQALLARATETAGRLLALGQRDGAGNLSWATVPDRRANLTGFGHGAAGIAHGLLVLDSMAPDAGLREAAAAAFAYEAGAFDPGHCNWPDYRLLQGYPSDQLSFPVAWCHGAGGILRSRLIAATAGLDVAHDIAAGLAASAAEVTRALGSAQSDFTLCHGILGLADGLLDAARQGHGLGLAPLAAAARQGLEIHHQGELPWPSGLLTREEASGLMIGNAGIGHFYLRLADPALESLLAPGASLIRPRPPTRG
ncbi:MAG TPA: lanthionine synthetase LanC family protein [Allosphingosinicella sp.]